MAISAFRVYFFIPNLIGKSHVEFHLTASTGCSILPVMVDIIHGL